MESVADPGLLYNHPSLTDEEILGTKINGNYVLVSNLLTGCLEEKKDKAPRNSK
jgi:hypothetical protein